MRQGEELDRDRCETGSVVRQGEELDRERI